MIFFRKPVPTPDQVRGRLFRDHALNRSRDRGRSKRHGWRSVSRRVLKNPLSLLIGGVATVIMELAEPRM
jgi:uncharacterized protein (DUF2236 family)